MNGSHQVALWAGIAAFFSSLLAIGLIDIFNPDQLLKFATSILVAVVTAGAVYSKQRLDDAKGEPKGDSAGATTRRPNPRG